jgi:CheY-like chemotaxis protein
MATVLVVDDVEPIRQIFARILRQEGFTTVCASNGQEALNALVADPPDVILLDIMMPEMDGLDCLAAMRRDPRGRQTPIIMMSALCDQEHRDRARALGAQEYLVKSHFTVEDLLDRIYRCVPRN